MRVTVEGPVAVFESAHYFRCSLNSGRDDLSLREDECIDAEWVCPTTILELGTVMDLRRIIPVLELAGLEPPDTPDGLSLAVPKKVF